jgi:hypothetical protein
VQDVDFVTRREIEQGLYCARSEFLILMLEESNLYLTLGGLRVKHAVQREIWVTTQNLL